jgi:hypothetical protein
MEKNKIPGFFGEKGRVIITVKKYICHINALTSSNSWTEAIAYDHSSYSLPDQMQEWQRLLL